MDCSFPSCSQPRSDTLFGPIKDALHGRHFADDSELKQNLHDVLQSQGPEFYNTGIQCLTQRWQKSVENDSDFVKKEPHNSKRSMNQPHKFHCYCSYIFHEKTGGITFVPSFIVMFLGKTSKNQQVHVVLQHRRPASTSCPP
jgi:hypothetical protein